MSLEIILGDAGAGKTTWLLQEIIQHAEKFPNQNHLLLVPEQFCLSTQQKLTVLHPRHALLNIEALSFDRLAARCFRELHVNTAEILSESAKTMLLSLAVRDCKGRLQVYERQSAYPSFIRRVSSLFAEWTMNDLEPARIRELSREESLGQLLRCKLQDLALLWEAFQKRLGHKQTAEEMLPLFSKLLPRSSVGRAEYLYLDGYTGFTTVQYRILETLMRRCGETRVMLTLPPEEDREKGSPHDLFFLSRSSIRRLEQTAQAAGQLSRISSWPNTCPKKPNLAALRTHLFRRTPPDPLEIESQAIQVVACMSPEDEARLAADLIQSLVGQEGCRYRDVAITVSDQNLYLPMLKRELKERGIPFFSDRREPLAHHPLIRLVLDALEAASDNLPREKVLKCVKNPGSPLSREEADAFENYLLAAGIRRGKDFKIPFTRTRKRRPGEPAALFEERSQAELAQAEKCRQTVIEPLTGLQAALGRRLTAAAGVQAIKEFLSAWGLGQRLEEVEKEFEALAEEGASWSDALGQLDLFFGNMEAILGDTPFTRREFADLVRAALEGLALGRLPMSPDQVIIGDILRSRLGDIKTLIFLGMNEGLVPKNRSESRLLTDHDRLALSLLEEDLGYTDQKAMAEERFYLYCLLQKPTDSLYISYARMGTGEERNRLPAFAIQEIEKILGVKTVFYRPEEGKPSLQGEEMARVLLTEESIRSLFGDSLRTSVSGLQSFVSCPFRFFLERGLGLEKRQELEWSSGDHGSLFHKVAELMLREIKEKQLDVPALTEAEKKQLVASVMEKAAVQVGLPGEADSPVVAYSLKRWQHFFETYLTYLGEEGLKDGFIPEDFEVNFGRDEYREIAHLPLSRGRSLRLSGVLDRVDSKEQPEGTYLRVVDYKTYKSAAFSPAELVAGKQLQLPVYLDMILRKYKAQYPEKTILPGGIAYEALAEQLTEWKEKPEEIKKELWKLLGLSGITAQEVTPPGKDEGKSRSSHVKSARMLELTADYARDRISRLGEEVFSGDMTPAPWEEGNQSTSCSYCDMQRACPFLESKAGCRYRRVELSKEEAWETISRIGAPEEEEHGIQ